MGMPIMAGADLGAFLNLTRSLSAAWHVTQRFTRHLLDLAVHGRAMQLVNGVALVARLAKSAEDLGVLLWESAPVTELLQEGDQVRGAVVSTAKGEIRIHARKAVVLAAGGFANDIERRKALFPRTPTGHEHLALPPLSVSGDGLRLGESAGARVNTDMASPVAWAPVSQVPHKDGSIGHFPHIIERGKPGIIGVLSNGQRFVNEANGYYDYVTAMVAAAPQGEEVASWLICSHGFQRRYGLGISRPFPVPLSPFIRSGYLKTGKTLEALAQACGIDPNGLRSTLSQYNHHAHKGEDPRSVAARHPKPQTGRSVAAPQPLHRTDRTRPVLCREGPARLLRHLRRPEGQRTRSGPRRIRTGHRRAVRRGRRHGQHHGWALPRRRHQSRPGADVRLHRRTTYRRHYSLRTGDRPCSTSLTHRV